MDIGVGQATVSGVDSDGALGETSRKPPGRAKSGGRAPDINPGEMAALEAGYRRAMKADAAQIDVLVDKAREKRTRGDHAGAVPIFRAASQCRPKGVVILADLAVSLWALRMVPEAEAALNRVLELDPAHGVALSVLGRVALHRNDPAAALPLFQRALERRPDDTTLREEIGRTLMQLGLMEQAASVWQDLLEMLPENVRIMAALAHVRRGQGEFEAALALYQRALKRSPGDARLREHLCRMLTRLNRLDEAAAVYTEMLDESPASPALLLALAQVRRTQGDNDAAADLARRAIAIEPSPQAYAALGLVEMRDLHRQAEAEAAFLAAVAMDAAYSPALHQLGMLARSAVDDEAALGWFQRAAAAAPDDPSLRFEVAMSLLDLERTAECEAVLASVEAMPAAPTHERLQLSRLNHCCKAMRLDAAMECLRTFGAAADWPSPVVPLAAGLLAARSNWDDVMRVFIERVVPATGARFVAASHTLVESVGRAARALGRQAEVLELLPKWSAAGTQGADGLRDQMAEELLVLHRVWPELPAPAELPGSALRAERGARMAAALATAGTVVRGTVFLCSDLNYLPGTVVAISSVLRHNRAALRGCRFCVFLSEDAMDLARPMMDRLGEAYGVTIEVVSADTLGRASTGFRKDWGSFTPGHRLSDAAYYRILAALWLAGQDDAGRAVYLDSDTCMGAGVAELLRFDLAGQPLGARLEESMSGAIRRAAKKLGMAAEDYFNSGVLILDLGHAACVPALQNAFEVAVGSPERLSYLDQCALNLAFLGQVTPVPDRFNMFTRHQDDVSALPDTPIVTHYLSRPKPWDPAYCSATGARWLEEFYALGDVLEAAQMRALLGLPFRDAVLF